MPKIPKTPKKKDPQYHYTPKRNRQAEGAMGKLEVPVEPALDTDEIPPPVIDWSGDSVVSLAPRSSRTLPRAEPPPTWWEEILQEHAPRFHYEVATAVERLQRQEGVINLFDPAFQEARRVGQECIEHTLSGKVLAGKLPAREKRQHMKHFTTLMEGVMAEILAEILGGVSV